MKRDAWRRAVAMVPQVSSPVDWMESHTIHLGRESKRRNDPEGKVTGSVLVLFGLWSYRSHYCHENIYWVFTMCHFHIVSLNSHRNPMKYLIIIPIFSLRNSKLEIVNYLLKVIHQEVLKPGIRSATDCSVHILNHGSKIMLVFFSFEGNRSLYICLCVCVY